MREKLLKIINHYGLMAQLKYLHTEYFELDQAIINYEQVHHIFEDVEERDHIIEELGDVMVMLLQIQLNYKITDEELAKNMEYKINRQLERINKEVGDV